MKRAIIGLVLVLLLLVSVSCASSQESGPLPMPAPTPTTAPSAPPSDVVTRPTEVPGIKEDSAAESPGLGQAWAEERMIVRTGDISLVVNDVAVAIDQISGLAEDSGGYVVSSQRWQDGERMVGNITIRVPADIYGNTMAALRNLAVEVTYENTSSQDVTEEYVDLNAKLGNLEATEKQLLRLLEQAETVEEMLAVQRELTNTRGEIEQTKGRMQYLERTSATSLIRVQLNQAEFDVNFNANKNRVKEGEEIEFEGRIAGGFVPYSYEWEFGDGETSTSQYPVHSYNTAGSYTVSLKVTDDRGNTDTRTRDEYIIVRPGWSAGSVASGAWNGLMTFGQVLADILIWIGVFAPVWIVAGAIVYLIRRRGRRSKA